MAAVLRDITNQIQETKPLNLGWKGKRVAFDEEGNAVAPKEEVETVAVVGEGILPVTRAEDADATESDEEYESAEEETAGDRNKAFDIWAYREPKKEAVWCGKRIVLDDSESESEEETEEERVEDRAADAAVEALGAQMDVQTL
jgi:hypothetical protein